MKKFKCLSCGKIHEGEKAPEKCECGHTEFEEVKVEKKEENKDNKRFENLEKKLEMLIEQNRLAEEENQRKIKEKDDEILKLKKASAKGEELKELEAEEERRKSLDEQAKILKVAKEKDEENKKLKIELDQKDFENFKLKTSIEKPYLETILNKCNTREKYEITMEVINEADLKAQYEADNNSVGSVVNIKGTVPVDKTKPKTAMEKLAELKATKEAELIEKKNRRKY